MSFEVTKEVILYTQEGFDPQDDLSRLEDIWKQFATSRTIPSEDLRPSIVNSWERCQDQLVDQEVRKPVALDPVQLKNRLQSNQEILDVVRPVIAQVEKLVASSKFLISYVDHEGYILAIHGDEQLRKQVEEIHFKVGANWSEKSMGTTAVGVALATGQPSQVYHAEHLLKGLHGFTCSAVPIHHPFTKQVIGVLDFVSLVENFQHHTLGMAVQMSRCIGLEIYRNHQERESIFRECSTQLTLDHLQRGVLVLDQNRRIRRMNLTALEYLGMDNDQLLDRAFNELAIFSSWHDLERPLQAKLADGAPAKLEYKPLLHNRRLIGSLILIEPIEGRASVKTTLPSRREGRRPVGESDTFKRVIKTARHAAKYDSNVLIMGETGTGKEVLAHYIHDHSHRCDKPFLAINCGSIPTELLGSELFGYEAGAFTGAKRRGHPSKFELAEGGTLLLDEISEMPAESQVYLLRVLEERMLTRLGGTKAIPVDVRVIAASNKDLQQLVDANLFRGDLFFRLNVIRLDLPTLNQRHQDIALLANHFLNSLSGSMGDRFQGFAPGVIQALCAYPWPGNVRELRNVIEQAMVMSPGNFVTYESLPDGVRQSMPIPENISEKDRERYLRFIQLYQDLNGNISRIARELQVSRPTVYAWKEKFGMSQKERGQEN